MPSDSSDQSILSEQLLHFLRQHEVTTPTISQRFSHALNVLDLDASTSERRFDQIFDNVGREAERLVRAQNICRSLCRAFRDPETHLQRLDDGISVLLDFDVIHCRRAYDSAVRLACQLLARTSADVQPYSEIQETDPCSSLGDGFFVSPVGRRGAKDLKVCNYFDVNTRCIALVVGLNQPRNGQSSWSGLSTSSYIDLLTQLLRAALVMVPAGDLCTVEHLFLLRAFLWTSWQRCVMLLRWSLLQFGNRIVWANTVNRRVTEVQQLRESIAAPVIQKSYSRLIPVSMCPWAFTHLQAHPAAAGVDFHYFLSRYATHFGSRPARCILKSDGSYRQCAGDGPFGCNRFTGAVIRDQSAHRATCSGTCPRLFWDEGSYRNVQGARAVDLEATTDSVLNYRAASYGTLAISHVWGHGQGGRPERPEEGVESTGFNICLHRRYRDIARQLQCDSYWIDTACIPQDHQLRREAISQINWIFATSRITLLCDLDIMAIDITHKTFSVLESILVAFLVCDWSLRAWTLLEGFRGAQNIHLLCKSDAIISLGEVISAIHESGRLSLANLCLTIDHLLSASGPASDKFGVRGWGYQEDGQSVQGAATMLKQRHASRDGDDIVIWSLLCGRLAYSAEEFWRGTYSIRTGFLVSDAPRVTNVPGLSWAPRRPNIEPTSPVYVTDRTISAHLTEGTDTVLGDITPEGLIAQWRFCGIENVTLWSLIYHCCGMSMGNFFKWKKFSIFWKTRLRRVLMEASYYWQMFWLPPKVRQRMQDIAVELQVPLPELALIQPSRNDNLMLWDLSARQTSLVVVQSTNNGSWVWKKVLHFSPDDDIFLVPFRSQTLVIE